MEGRFSYFALVVVPLALCDGIVLDGWLSVHFGVIFCFFLAFCCYHTSWLQFGILMLFADLTEPVPEIRLHYRMNKSEIQLTCESDSCGQLLAMLALMFSGWLVVCRMLAGRSIVSRLLAFRGWSRQEINTDTSSCLLFMEHTMVGRSQLTTTKCYLLYK